MRYALALLLLVVSVKAATLSPASNSLADVQALLDDAGTVTGDIIQLLPGSASWSSAVTIPAGKVVTIRGAGTTPTGTSRGSAATGGTTLTQTGGSALFVWYNASRLTNIKMIMDNASAGGVGVGSTGWRIDHITFESPTFRDFVSVFDPNTSAHPTGLVDHCDVTNGRVVVAGDSNLLAHAIWNAASSIGTANAVFVEDNTFLFNVHGSAVDANYGGKYVFRYNTITDCYIEFHSFQSYNARAGRSFEIYENDIAQSSRSMYAPFYIRGGTGVIYSNRITGTWSAPGGVIENMRSSVWITTAGFASGGSLYDENAAVVSGTHSGSANATTLTDSTKSWTTNQFVLAASTTGTHDGSNNASTLSDADGAFLATFAATGVSAGYVIVNVTDGSSGIVTDATNTTVTATLTGGTDNDWDTGDTYEIRHGLWVWNTTKSTRGVITANTATTITARDNTGAAFDWDNGDAYKIANGYPARDQIGRGADTTLASGQTLPWPTQASEPMYYWSNTNGGNPITIDVVASGLNETHIVENRDFYTDGTQRPDYVAYTYPHPLQGATGTTTVTGTLTVTGTITLE